MKYNTLVLILIIALTIIFAGCGKKDTVNTTVNTNQPANQAQTQVSLDNIQLDKDFNCTYYFSSKDGIYKIKEGSTDKESVATLTSDNWIYFSTFNHINKINKDGTGFKTILDRPESGSDMRLDKIVDGWLYYEIASEDGVNQYKIKTDGTGKEISVDNSDDKSNNPSVTESNKQKDVNVKSNNSPNSFSEDNAVELVAKEFYNGSKENLFVDTNLEYQLNVYIIRENIDFGSGLYTTMQAYLVKDGKVLETLNDKNGNLNKNFWNYVKNYEKK